MDESQTIPEIPEGGDLHNKGRRDQFIEMEETEDDDDEELVEIIRPLGESAPIDITNLTPLGLYCSKKKKKKNEQIESYFHREGDRSITPFIDPYNRIGGNPSLEFGYAHIPGWHATMEDRILAISPLEVIDESSNTVPVGGAGWGLFAVFDGHGGARASDFVANHFLDCFLEAPSWLRFIENSEEFQELRKDENSSPNFEISSFTSKGIFDMKGNNADYYYNVDLLKLALEEAILMVEDKLSQLPEF